MRYLRIWGSFFRASWMADLEYRVNLIVRIIGELTWYTVQLSVFEVLYTHTNSINGWTVHAMRVFMGTLFTVDNIYMFFFMDNIEQINSVVRKGELDLYLAKPINAQFMVSCRKVAVVYILNMFIVISYLAWSVRHLETAIGAPQIAAYVVTLLSGVITYYALRFMFSTLVIILQDAGSVQFIWHQLFRLATRPDPIYPGPLRVLVLFLFPIGFLASVPARVLVEGLNGSLLIAAPFVATTLLFLSHVAWNGALKRYSSASS